MFVVKIFANAPLCLPFLYFFVRMKDKRGGEYNNNNNKYVYSLK